jgi:beta-N-acetylhexosaminidase
MRRWSLAALVLLAAVFGAACGGDDEPEVTPTVEASPTSTVTATATAEPTVTSTSTPSATPEGDDLASMPLEVKVGQLLFTGVPGTAVGPEAQRLIAELHLGNVVVMGANAGTPAQVAALTADLQQLALESNGVGAIIATDQEGGLVQRLVEGFTSLPEAAVIGSGAAGNADLARQYGAMVGAELRAAGVNMDLAPVLDVNDNPANPVIGRRAFGTTPAAVIDVTLPFIEGLHDELVAAVGKHFPGHGNTETDSHFTLPVVHKSLEELEATELAPFRAAIEAGIDAIMVAHVAYPSLDPSGLPASISSTIVTGLLRQQLGFDGVVVTDDMGMAGVAALMPSEQAVVESVKAGVDLVICVSLPCDAETAQSALIAAVESGDLPLSRVDDAVRRVLALKQQLEVERTDVGNLEAVGSAEHQTVVDEIVARAGG